MNKLKFYSLVTIGFTSLTLILSIFVSSAKADCVGGGGECVINPVPGFNFKDLIADIIALLPYITMIGLIGAVLTIAYTLIFSWAQGSNAEPVQKVRKVAMYVLIGFVVMIFAPFIIGLLLNILGITGLSTIFTIP